MKVFILLFLSNISISISQNLIPFWKDYKYGYSNLNKEIIIQPQFDGCGFFNDGLAWFKKGTKFGYINSSGKIAIDAIYSTASNFKHGAAIVYNGVDYHIIDKKGTKLNKQGLLHAFRVADSLFACDTGYNLWRIINNKGKTKYEFKAIDLYFDNMDYVIVKDSVTNKDSYFNLKTNKTQVLKPLAKNIRNSKNLKIIESKPKNHTEEYISGVGLVDSKGDTIVPAKYNKLINDESFNFFAYHTLKLTKEISQIYIASKNKKSKFTDAYIQNIKFEQNHEPFAYQLINSKYYFLCEITADDLPFMQYYICIDEDGNTFYEGNKEH